MSLLYGDGDGAFAPPASLVAGSQAWDVVLPDLNGDARPDIAVVDQSNATVAVRMNTGPRTFAAVTTRPVGNGPHALVAGRFAGNDAAIDLAVVNMDDDTVTVLQNDGSGGTTTAATLPVLGDAPHAIASGDLNHDGRADLVTANDSQDLTVLLAGAGGFVRGPLIPLGRWGHRVTIGDVNGDDHLDLVVLATFDNKVVIAEGAGDGTFATPETLGDDVVFPTDAAVRDLDGDGTGDLLVSALTDLAVSRSAGVAGLSASTATFGRQAQATLSPSQAITVTNDGAAPLRIDGVRLSGAHPGDFLADRGTCVGTVAPSATCTLSVPFAPQATGTRTAQLGLTGHVVNAATATVALTGSGGALPTGPAGRNQTGAARAQAATG